MSLPWVASVLKWLGHAQYNSAPPVLAEGEVSALQCDGEGNLKVSLASGETGSALVATVADVAEGAVVKASAGKLYEIAGFSTAASTRYLVVMAGSVLPEDGTSTASKIVVRIPASADFCWTPERPVPLAGIVWVCSSTRATITKSSDFYAWAHYL